MTAVHPELLPAAAIFHNRYEVVRIMVSGGMGTVYEVVDRVTRRRRALKTMHPSLMSDSDVRGRFRQEATVTADIKSDHIVEVFDAGIDETSAMPFLVMELLVGEDLGSLLTRKGRCSCDDAIVYLWQAAMALEKTHAAGIVHRDLKPENLFLAARDDGSPHVKGLDFGIAKIVAQGAGAKTTRNIGTPLYMSPEQIRGDATIDARADCYALGHIAFTLLVGESYWRPEASAAHGAAPFLVRVLKGASEKATERAQRAGVALPTSFDDWFERATALESSQRYSSATELVDALSIAFSVPRPGGGRAPELARPRRTRLILMVSASALLVLAAAGAIKHFSRAAASEAAASKSLLPENVASSSMAGMQHASASPVESTDARNPKATTSIAPTPEASTIGQSATNRGTSSAINSRSGSAKRAIVAKPIIDPTDFR